MLPRFLDWHLELTLVPLSRLQNTEGGAGGEDDQFCLACGKFGGPGGSAVLVETGLGSRT